MAPEIRRGIEKEEWPSTPGEKKSSTAARRRRMEIRRVKSVAGVGATAEYVNDHKRQKVSDPRYCDYNVYENCASSEAENGRSEAKAATEIAKRHSVLLSSESCRINGRGEEYPRFGIASVCGRRRDMEDAVAIHPSFCRSESETTTTTDLHYFGVFDGHGCSHVAMKCRDRLHEVVKEEMQNLEESSEWGEAMKRSFFRMDKEVIACNGSVAGAKCRCELRVPLCDVVGSTAVVAILTPDKFIVANCGDSRAVLCRDGKAIPLSTDHKPDRADELSRIEAAGGRVIYWDGPRVLGVLGMSRAIGDNHLKPYVICDPDVTITERTDDDECLILASDGLWDVMSNETACGVARMCLSARTEEAVTANGSCWPERDAGGNKCDKACSDASMLLMKMALARGSTDNVSVVVIDLRRNK